MTEPRFDDHLETVSTHVERALELARDAGVDVDGALFHSGTRRYYHRDDRPIPFRPTGHFLRFAPLFGPDHVIRYEAGRIELFEMVPRDYWEEVPAPSSHPFRSAISVSTVPDRETLVRTLGDGSRLAYLGDDPALASRLGVDPAHVEPTPLVQALDWFRAEKTDYEIGRIRAAVTRAARGYRAALEGFHARECERAINDRFYAATEHRETDIAFDPVIAWDDHASILHYQSKRTSAPERGRVLLVDAGASVDGYSSDTTRTYLHDGTPDRFRTIVARLGALVDELIEAIRPGVEVVALHERADRGIAEILCDTGVLRVSADEAFAQNLTAPFFPHGLGHHLGICVHDSGGFLRGPADPVEPPPKRYPFLRTTRPLDERHVMTIEPGIYFIPLLLDPFRGGPNDAAFDWKGIDQELRPCGGVRIEDDVRVTASGSENLTRVEIPR
ncbi:MAG: Xaa-Pro dipeptidase [Planctomycetes bacterium]|nr:Xaa-Pro dipeptidase [Planctomycetota bacterium]